MRNMRRIKQLLSDTETAEIFEKGTSGVLAVLGDGGYPYAVPLSYVYSDGKIYFHSAKTGHKIDAVRACDKVSFCVIDEDHIVPEEYTTYFRSAIAFGKARIIEDEGEKMDTVIRLAQKYCPDDDAGIRKEAESGIANMCMVEISVEMMTGKEAIEFVRAKEKE